METKYPNITVCLTGVNGNAFSIIAEVKRALRKAGISTEEQDKFFEEATASDYDNVLQTAMRWVNVE